MSNEVDPKDPILAVERVNNGWTVRHGSFWLRPGECANGVFVATTPDQLATLIETWASRQLERA